MPITTGPSHPCQRVFLTVGDRLTITAAQDDLWSAGDSSVDNRISNANGLDNFPLYTYGGFSAEYGSLVGCIGTGNYFKVGTSYDACVSDTGELQLMYWDSNFEDNSGLVSAITTNINICPNPPSVPAPAALILGSLGTGLVGWICRKA